MIKTLACFDAHNSKGQKRNPFLHIYFYSGFQPFDRWSKHHLAVAAWKPIRFPERAMSSEEQQQSVTCLLMGFLLVTKDYGLRMSRQCRERFPRHRIKRKPLVNDPGMHQGTCVMHVGIANPRWRGERSRHSRRMRNSQFYVSDKRPVPLYFTYKGLDFILWTVQKYHGDMIFDSSGKAYM